MTIEMPEGFDAAGNGSLFAAPAVAVRTAPSLTEFAPPTGFNFSCDAMAWAPTADRARVSSNRYCLEQAIERFGRKTYTIEPMEIVYNPQNPEDENYVAYLKFKEDTTWEIFDRRGLPSKKPLEAGEYGVLRKVSVGLVDDVPITDAEGELLRARITFAVIDEVLRDVQIAA